MLANVLYWCRHVEGLSAVLLPDNKEISQGTLHRSCNEILVEHPEWIECAHVSPVFAEQYNNANVLGIRY